MDYYSHNGSIKPLAEATHSLLSVEFSYGFGVYENIRVKNTEPLYVGEHIDRLFTSANTIELEHDFSSKQIEAFIAELASRINQSAYNLKVLLIGGQKPNLYIIPMRPKFPDRKLYKTGAKAIIVKMERYLPNVKSLNMLPSYLAFREAKKEGAYDALLENKKGELVEGTRTNLFVIKGKTITTPPAGEVLVGVTRTHVLNCAKKHGYTVAEGPIKIAKLTSYDSLFLSSTSSKIMPISELEDIRFEISKDLVKLMNLFNEMYN